MNEDECSGTETELMSRIESWDLPVEVAVVVPSDGARVWARCRRAGHLEGHWEFPGGKIRPRESAVDAARREMLEETGLWVEDGELEPLTSFQFDYPDRKVRLHFFLLVTSRHRLPGDGAWVDTETYSGLRIPPANRRVVPLLRKRLARPSG
jgi:8-oxo-dGTP diphosphatase